MSSRFPKCTPFLEKELGRHDRQRCLAKPPSGLSPEGHFLPRRLLRSYNARSMVGGKRKVRDEHSSGGAVIALRDGRPHVAMIATRGRLRWGLPKGAVSEGETSEQAALREVLEETGLEADIVRPLDTIEYYFRVGDTLIRKRVDFYLMTHDDVEWVELSQAIQRASFDSEKKLLELASIALSSSK
jgi:8-oxo-dGTP pyrophosphatase MutT (NUDIX family)